MRSIFVLLILVMIGLNGKGQSVTALPDSVLSQCCLEVTLLNGNVTTVDWVFIQYITRDGTGTKLFVEYAPNFGGIQWETQIRIQDDFDGVLERSKFIMLPFTVGTTDYGINRNWIANIEENTTTGGTWIYGRFGTPTKRKFSAVEDYETLKNLLLACRPRAIVVAENGLYTEGDTVRMGGFLIENTTITTEGYNWMMKDTLSSVEFGLDYLTPETGDTTVYWGRRHGSIRQMVQLGRRYYYNSMRDTTGGLYSDLTHSWNSGDPFLQYQIFNPLDPNSGTAWFKVQKDNAFLVMSNETTNPYYTSSFSMSNSNVQIGVNESGSGDPGNGVGMGAYGFGTTEYLYMITKGVDDETATAGQYLQLINASSGEVDFATIDLSAYLPIADTAAMLSKYIERGDTAAMLTNYPTKAEVAANPTTITAGQVAYSNGTNLVGSANHFWDNTNVRLGIGTNAPSREINISRTIDGAIGILIQNPSTGSGAESVVNVSNGTTPIILGKRGTNYGTYKTILANDGYLYNAINGDISILNDYSSGKIKFAAGASSTAQMTLAATGNLLLGTTTDVPTSILTARSTTKASSPFPLQTLAEADAIAGVQGNFQYETTQNGLRWYNGTRKAYALESTFARGTPDYVPVINSNGQITESQYFRYLTSTNTLNIGNVDIKISSANIGALTSILIGQGTVGTQAVNIKGSSVGNGGVVVGHSSSATSGVSIGNSSTTTTGISIGTSNPSSATGIAIGEGATSTGYGISFGRRTTAPGSQYFVAGSAGNNSNSFTDVFFGSGIQRGNSQGTTDGNGVDYTINGSGALGTNFNGGNITIAGGKGTGTGTAGDVIFSTSATGSSGSVLQSLTQRWWVKGQTGFFGNTSSPAQELDVNGDAYIRDSTRLTTTPAHSAITGLLTRDANGWVGLTTIGTGLSYLGGVLSATGSADGNGIYSSSATLANHTTRARVPDNGNLFFSQTFNGGADSSYFYINNYLSGERAVGFGLTDTASTGYSRGFFYSDGAGEMNWELETSGASGTTSVKAQDGTFNVTTTGGDMSLNAGVADEVRVVGLVRAKQEAYYEITSTSSPQTLSSDYSDNFINQGGTQASFTFLFPASPEDGQILTLTYNNAISTLTLDGNGNTITGSAVTTAVAGSQRKFKFYAASGTWIKIY